ncbi:MAG TPA: GNAT family N-acetyltransferase [Kofleriaceae bacterium]
MNIRSLALTTELALIATRGRVTDRGGYLVLETPDDPGYYHGNLLVFPAAPQPGELVHWLRKFDDELGRNPAIKHVTFCWDGITGDQGAAEELRDAGFQIDTHELLAAELVEAAPATLPTRLLAPDEVLATADLAWQLGDRHDETYRQFLHRRAAWHRDLVARGAARFYGAFDGTSLVASLGLVRVLDLGRYQDVQTLPAYRKRGLARALLAAAARDALGESTSRLRADEKQWVGVDRVVIVAEPGSPAARLYARAGFRAIELTVSASRYPPDISRPIRVR